MFDLDQPNQPNQDQSSESIEPPQLSAHLEEDKEVENQEERKEGPTGVEPSMQQEAQHEELQPGA